jgi:hypothetical protein
VETEGRERRRKRRRPRERPAMTPVRREREVQGMAGAWTKSWRVRDVRVDQSVGGVKSLSLGSPAGNTDVDGPDVVFSEGSIILDFKKIQKVEQGWQLGNDEFMDLIFLRCIDIHSMELFHVLNHVQDMCHFSLNYKLFFLLFREGVNHLLWT